MKTRLCLKKAFCKMGAAFFKHALIQCKFAFRASQSGYREGAEPLHLLRFDIVDCQKGVENRGIKKRKCADASDKKPCSQPGNV